MSRSVPMDCPVCGQVVLEIRPGVPRIHYQRGTNDMCAGSNQEPNLSDDNG